MTAADYAELGIAAPGPVPRDPDELPEIEADTFRGSEHPFYWWNDHDRCEQCGDETGECGC